MTLAEVFNPNIIKVGLESDDKDELFEEMVQVIVDSDSSLNRGKLLEALEQRESLMSTGIIHDVAVPHGKTDAVKNIVGCVGLSKKGIDYDSLDNEPVHIVFMLIYPTDLGEENLHIFKRLAIILESGSFKSDLLQQQTPQGVYEVICRYEEELGDMYV
ncbi:MAG: PTS sugar transporter subunit IIA [Spirochaetaceae bacterium]|nr:PTS sugar transporter subunit IIA [Spirochaetaceae bacterium]